MAFNGDVLLSAMPRLAAAMDALERAPTEADSANAQTVAADAAHYELLFARDREGRCIVTGRVRATLKMRCQRCLDEVEVPVDAPIALALIRRDEDALELPEDLDPWMVVDERVDPMEFVEDELLLAVPAIPRHPLGACSAGPIEGDDAAASAGVGAAGSDGKRRPFEMLAALKRPPQT
ncbi:YceD family protein [Thiocapsa rosea]|nr:YceD family protein [Thiocapsa rosea]